MIQDAPIDIASFRQPRTTVSTICSVSKSYRANSVQLLGSKEDASVVAKQQTVLAIFSQPDDSIHPIGSSPPTLASDTPP